MGSIHESYLSVLDANTIEKKAYGSGSFGEWIVDDLNNPAFRYTSDQRHDPKAETPVTPGGLLGATEHIHQVGNDRLVAIASNHGYVQVRQDEGGPKFLNSFSLERSQFGGGIGYLTDGKEMLSTFYSPDGNPKQFERVFGMGYFQKKIHSQRLSVDQVIQTPFGDDPVVLSQVTITNKTSETLSDLCWIEYWGCHQYQFSFRQYMLAQAHKTSAVEMRHKFSDRFQHSFTLLDGRNTGLMNKQTYTGDSEEENAQWEALKPVLAANPTMFAGGAVSEPADGNVGFDDLNPPRTFLASLDAPSDVMSTNGEKFFGSQGVSKPSGLLTGLTNDLSYTGASSAMLIQRRLSLSPAESRTLYFLYGYCNGEGDSQVSALVEKYRHVASTTWKDSSKLWNASGMKFSAQNSWIARETAWHYYYLRSALTYDSYFQEHILTQGAQYVYVMGNNSSARDPLQHVLPLVYSDPQIVKEVLRYTLKSVRTDGSIPYGMVGHGMPMPTIMDDASDIPLFLLWLASEYVLATRDHAFLDESVLTYPLYSDTPNRATVFSLLQSAYQCMQKNIGTGEHGLFRQLQDDWNDAVIALWVPKQHRDECVRDGESVPNSAMATYVFKHYARMIEYVRKLSTPTVTTIPADLAATALRDAEHHRQATTKTWTGKWFKRAWLGSATGWLGEKNIWLEPQPWALIAEATDAQIAPILVDSIDKMLRQPSTIGAMQQNGPGENMTNGHKRPLGMSVNGGVWPALNVTLIWALVQNGYGSMAWEEWQRNSLAWHATTYPDVWYGTWSSLDSVNSAFNERPGRASYSEVFNQEDFPVTNSHIHASQLLGIPKLLGIEFKSAGLELRPSTVQEPYTFETALVGVSRSSAGYCGWYAPMTSGNWTVIVHLPEAETASVGGVEINGKRQEPTWTDARRLLIVGSSSTTERLAWKVEVRS